MAPATLYPPSPPDVPADLTEPTSQYKTQIALVLLSLGLFFLLYFGILAFCVLFMIWRSAACCLRWPTPASRSSPSFRLRFACRFCCSSSTW